MNKTHSYTLRGARAPAAALMVLLGLSACNGSDKTGSNGTAAENAVPPADEGTGRNDDAGVAAAMHNRMSSEAGTSGGANAAAMGGAGMGDDQMGSGGAMGNAQGGAMADDSMPMGGGNTASGMGTMADQHTGMKGGMNKPMSKPTPDKPMQDDM